MCRCNLISLFKRQTGRAVSDQQGAEVYQGEWVVSMGVSPAAVLLWYVVRHWAGDRAIRLELSVELNCLKPHPGIQCLLLETDFRYLKQSTF